jgi:hypothetical protein
MQWFFKPAPLLQLAGTGIERLDRTPCSRETAFRLFLRSFNRLWIAAEGLLAGTPNGFVQDVRFRLLAGAKREIPIYAHPIRANNARDFGFGCQVCRAAVTAARFGAEPEHAIVWNRPAQITGRQSSHSRCSLCISAPMNFR